MSHFRHEVLVGLFLITFSKVSPESHNNSRKSKLIAKYSLALVRTGWFRSTLGFDLLGFRSILVSICTRYQFQTAHYSIYTNSDLHSFRSAQFSLCNFWICKDFALLSIRSAQISICTDFDLHVFRYANQF